MKAHEIIGEVEGTLIQRGRQNGYDQAEERSAAEIVRLFNLKTGRDLSEREAWEFLRCLKEVRLRRQLENGSDPTDTLIDLVSYTVLLAECVTDKKTILRSNMDECE